MGTSTTTVEKIGAEADHHGPRDMSGFGEPSRLREWVGFSGRRYLHIVYGLVECPSVPKVNYTLVRRDPQGRETILRVGRASHEAPTLNLAQIRQEGALLGANEVHLHVLARSEAERVMVEFDLAGGLRIEGDCPPDVSSLH